MLRRKKQHLNFPPERISRAPDVDVDDDNDSGNGGCGGGDEGSFEVRPLIHPQKPADITITVRLKVA